MVEDDQVRNSVGSGGPEPGSGGARVGQEEHGEMLPSTAPLAGKQWQPAARQGEDSLWWVFAVLILFLFAVCGLLAAGGATIIWAMNRSELPATPMESGSPSPAASVVTDGRSIAEEVVYDYVGEGSAELPADVVAGGETSSDELTRNQSVVSETGDVELAPLPESLLKSARKVFVSGVDLAYQWEDFSGLAIRFSLQASDNRYSSGDLFLRPSQTPVAELVEKQEELADQMLMGGRGTGFLVHPEGLVVTCAHVIQNLDQPMVQWDGRQLPAQLLVLDESEDLALLKIPVRGAPYLGIRSETPSLGTAVRAFGFPLTKQLGSRMKMSSGTISGVDETPRGERVQSDATANPGNSGGPLTDDQGGLLGVLDSVLAGSDVAAVSLAIPNTKLLNLLAQHDVPVRKLPMDSNGSDPSLMVQRREDVAKAVVAIHSGSAEDSDWSVLDYELRISGKSKSTGQLLVDRLGHVINTQQAMMDHLALQDLAHIGVFPMGGTRRSWQEKDEAIVKIVRKERASGSSSVFDRHREMVEQMRRRPFGIPSTPFGGLAARDSRQEETTSSSIGLATRTDEFQLLQSTETTPAYHIPIQWKRSTRLVHIDGGMVEQSHHVGTLHFDRRYKRLRSGQLNLANDDGSRSKQMTLTFRVQDLAEFEESARKAAEKRAEQARKREEENNARRDQLDQLLNPESRLKSFHWPDTASNGGAN